MDDEFKGGKRLHIPRFSKTRRGFGAMIALVLAVGVANGQYRAPPSRMAQPAVGSAAGIVPLPPVGPPQRLPMLTVQIPADANPFLTPPAAVTPPIRLQLDPSDDVPAETIPESATREPLPETPRYELPLNTASSDSLRVTVENGKVSLAARDAPLRQILALIAKTENLNLVAPVGDETLTVSLDQVSLAEALDAVLTATGYTWNICNRIIYVTSMTGGSDLAPQIQGRQVIVVDLEYAMAADIDMAVQGLLSPIGQSWVLEGSATDNRRTREAVVIEDLPVYAGRIVEYIRQLDLPPRQVLIEVRMLEVELDDDCKHGVNFEHLASLTDTQVSIRTTGFANPTAPQAFFFETAGGNLISLIEALETTTDAKTLASPRIHAINGQESRIQIGQRLGFRVTTTTETSTLESVEFLDVGVVLQVTPRIMRDGSILMRIKPEVSSGRVSPDTGLPESETKELETDVLLHSGNGIVIGGLIQEEDINQQSKIPYLGDLPYVGLLFQRRQITKKRSELIIALVPHVLPLPENQYARDRHEFMRTGDPLVYGPLCRYPRPYEPRMPDTIHNPRGIRHPFQKCPEPPCHAAGGVVPLPAVPSDPVWAPDDMPTTFPPDLYPSNNQTTIPTTAHRPQPSVTR